MLKTPEAIDALAAGDEDRKRDIIAEAWEDFLDMTISQAILWAAHNIAPEERPSEVVLAEPYIMGSHSGGKPVLGSAAPRTWPPTATTGATAR